MVKIRTSRAGSDADEQGFTLLELLVVLAIIGFSVSLIPGFTLRDGSATALDHAAGILADGLIETRHQAVLQNRPSLFAINVDSSEQATRPRLCRSTDRSISAGHC